MRSSKRGDRIPLYRRISEEIRKDILTGIYLPGEILPSIRENAAALGAARNTVELAYQLLADEGYIQSKKGVGYEVLNYRESFNYEEDYEDSNGAECQTKEEESTVAAAKTQKPQPQIKTRSYPYDFRAVHFIGAFLSQSEWKDTAVRIYQEKEIRGSSYDQSLRVQLRRYLKKHRGIDCSEEQIFLFRSLSQAMHFIRRIQPNLLYIVPHHEGELGNHISEEEEENLLNHMRDNEVYIIEDDIDGELVYGRQPYHTLYGKNDEGRVIFTGTLEQVLGGFVQLQYIVLPHSLMKENYDLLQELRRENRHSFLEFMMLESLMKSDYWENYLRKVNYRLNRKRNLIIGKMHQYFGKDIELRRTESGTEITAVLRYSGDENDLLMRAEKAGLGLDVHSSTIIDPDKLYITFSYAQATEEQIDSGLKELSGIYKNLSRKGR